MDLVEITCVILLVSIGISILSHLIMCCVGMKTDREIIKDNNAIVKQISINLDRLHNNNINNESITKISADLAKLTSDNFYIKNNINTLMNNLNSLSIKINIIDDKINNKISN